MDAEIAAKIAAAEDVPRHQRSRRGETKPWRLEAKGVEVADRDWRWPKDWTTLKRYRCERDAMRGWRDATKPSKAWWRDGREWRLVDPNGRIVKEWIPKEAQA